MKLFHDLLEAHGYDTLQTKDGMEALQLARQHHPDLILMDIQLPEVSGLEVTKWIKEDDDLRSIPIIAVTAFAMKGDEEKIREGGCEAYIAKPISVANFLQTVASVSELERNRRSAMSARILVVDDVDVNVKVARGQAVERVFQRAHRERRHGGARRVAQDERPDLILLDVMMPRMDGFEICRRLKADPRTADIPVVMVTALSEPADRVRGLEAGADDFLTKPVNDIALFARVRSLVRLRRMTEEWRHREDVYGRFDTLFGTEAADRGSQSRRASCCGKRTAFAGTRIAEMLAPVGERDRPAGARPKICVASCDPTIDLVILSLPGKVDALRVVSQLRANEASRHGADPADRRSGANCRGSPKGSISAPTDYLLRPLDRNELIARAAHPDPAQAAAGPVAGELSEEPVAGADRRSDRALQPPLSDRRISTACARAQAEGAQGARAAHLRHRLVQARQRYLWPCGGRRRAARSGGRVVAQCPRLRSGRALWRRGIRRGAARNTLAVALVVAERLRSVIADQPIELGEPPSA